MRIKEVMKLSPMDRLIYWIMERDMIRSKKENNEPKPWTDDQILQTYKFCNIRRMDDRVSQWLLNKFYQEDHRNIVVAAAIARHFNLPSCLQLIEHCIFLNSEPDWKQIKIIVRAHKGKGNSIFNGAYMVRGIGTTDKTEMVIDKVCRPLYDKPPLIERDSMEASVNALLPYWGFSSFMAGQVVADLRHVMTGPWRDRRIWAPLGPGSQRGLNRLYGFVATAHQTQEEFRGMLDDTIRDLPNHLPLSIIKRMEAIDYQNCLCEFDKYSRTLSGEGRPKQKYPGL